jgi:acyl-homoserine-lactone acylase
MNCWRLCLWVFCLVSITAGAHSRAAEDDSLPSAEALRERVTIYRDEFGLAHIVGDDDESTIFGFGYVQAEDYFWQIEDVYILALGRYSEVHGPQGLNSDLLNRAFEIVPRSKRDFAALDRTSRRLYAAFVTGINYYLQTHPDVRPRLIERFEPWHVLAYYRHVALELCFRATGLSNDFLPRRNPHVWAAAGSNGWAISGVRTASGSPMLLASPHMPWFGFSQLMECHLTSRGGVDGQPWNFTGAGFYGSPMPAMGHNDRLGWTLVTNQPDIADVWRVEFSNPTQPLAATTTIGGSPRSGPKRSASARAATSTTAGMSSARRITGQSSVTKMISSISLRRFPACSKPSPCGKPCEW